MQKHGAAHHASQTQTFRHRAVVRSLTPQDASATCPEVQFPFGCPRGGFASLLFGQVQRPCRQLLQLSPANFATPDSCSERSAFVSFCSENEVPGRTKVFTGLPSRERLTKLSNGFRG